MSWTSEKCSNILQHHRSETLICIVKYFWAWHLPNPHISSSPQAYPWGMRVTMTVTGDSSRYFTFVSFPTIFTLCHFICTSTKYFICDCRTGPNIMRMSNYYVIIWIVLVSHMIVYHCTNFELVGSKFTWVIQETFQHHKTFEQFCPSLYTSTFHQMRKVLHDPDISQWM